MRILGYDYTLVEETDDDGNLGRCMPTTQRIRIAPGLAEQQRQSVTLHEIIEALNYHLCLGLDDKTISPLEAGLFQVLTDAGVDLSPLMRGLRTRLQDTIYSLEREQDAQ